MAQTTILKTATKQSSPAKQQKPLKQKWRLSMNLADYVWRVVQFWSLFNQTTMGIPYTQTIDALTLQLSFEPSTDKDPTLVKSYRLTQEALLWTDKARRRKLLDKETYQTIYAYLKDIEQYLKKPKP